MHKLTIEEQFTKDRLKAQSLPGGETLMGTSSPKEVYKVILENEAAQALKIEAIKKELKLGAERKLVGGVVVHGGCSPSEKAAIAAGEAVEKSEDKDRMGKLLAGAGSYFGEYIKQARMNFALQVIDILEKDFKVSIKDDKEVILTRKPSTLVVIK
ncbi:hypothetical protein RWE39_004375 [Salmonella enterica]|nr:hypothetical protein [Salmonella enterica]